ELLACAAQDGRASRAVGVRAGAPACGDLLGDRGRLVLLRHGEEARHRARPRARTRAERAHLEAGLLLRAAQGRSDGVRGVEHGTVVAPRRRERQVVEPRAGAEDLAEACEAGRARTAPAVDRLVRVA